MKRLILLDEDNALTEIDWKAAKREAEILKALIEKASTTGIKAVPRPNVRNDG